MAKCNLCGAKIMAYLEVCDSCSNQMAASLSGPMARSSPVQFMKEMGINI